MTDNENLISTKVLPKRFAPVQTSKLLAISHTAMKTFPAECEQSDRAMKA